MALLGRLWERAGSWEQAHAAYKALSEVTIDSRARRLSGAERREVLELVNNAYLAQADASFREGNWRRALNEYERMAKHQAESPAVLWAQYQMGNCYLKLDRPLDGLREFQKGRSLISRFFAAAPAPSAAAAPAPLAPERPRAPATARHWLTASALSESAADLLSGLRRDSQLFPTGKAQPPPRPGGEGEPQFWTALYDRKIQLLSEKILKSPG
jgi:tetratricopeptide (TPR) repeat protein